MIARGRIAVAAIAAVAGLVAPGFAWAQVAGPQDPDPAIPEAVRVPDDDRIHVDITPDLWGLSMKANGRFGGSAVSGRIPLGKIIDHLDNLFLGEIDVRKGPLVLMADVTHAKITLPVKMAPLTGDRLPIGATFLTLAAGWSSGPLPAGSIAGRPVSISVQPFAGATYDSLDARLDGPGGTIAKLSPDWWSPMVGTRVDLARGRSSIRLEGYVAGFSHGRAGQQALASYALKTHWRGANDPTVGLGYRYSRQRRTVGADSLALRLSGPVAYVTFHL